jgi:hypothetical protein
MCSYLIASIVTDLQLNNHFPELPNRVPNLFNFRGLLTPFLEGIDPLPLFEKLVNLDPDSDMYYACLSTLLKARLKYQTILETQPIPTVEQVGPRALLQYGKMSPKSLAALLFWRKWFFDIDNRAGQETGYLFEPVIAYAIGGIPVPSSKSPVRRHSDPRKGRQIDCLLSKRAYEIKIRVTIAASGQGRWREELDYPIDCRTSGYTPVLVVLDSTPNPKLAELEKVFRAQSGEVYTGNNAWDHLDELAGRTMSQFLDKYVRIPMNQILQEANDPLLDFTARLNPDSISLIIGDETLHIPRPSSLPEDDDQNALPEDVSDDIPG